MCSPYSQHVLYILYDIILPEPSMFFQCDMWSDDHDHDRIMWYVTVLWQCDITLTLTLSSKIENEGNENRNENEKQLESPIFNSDSFVSFSVPIIHWIAKVFGLIIWRYGNRFWFSTINKSPKIRDLELYLYLFWPSYIVGSVEFLKV